MIRTIASADARAFAFGRPIAGYEAQPTPEGPTDDAYEGRLVADSASSTNASEADIRENWDELATSATANDRRHAAPTRMRWVNLRPDASGSTGVQPLLPAIPSRWPLADTEIWQIMKKTPNDKPSWEVMSIFHSPPWHFMSVASAVNRSEDCLEALLKSDAVDHNKVVTVSAIKTSIRVGGAKSRAKSESYGRRM